METAKLCASGRSQAVCLRKAFRFSGTEVMVKHFGGGQGGTGPRKVAAQDVVDVQPLIQRLNVRPRDQQFRVDDQVDMQRRSFAAPLKLFDRPCVPVAVVVDAVDPDVGMNPDAWCLRRARDPCTPPDVCR